MTTYNGERYIEQQLDSLLGQTHPIDEVVILDDRSSDGTAGRVRSFIDKNDLRHWRFEVNGKNLGYIDNFYKVIGLTTGDIIFLCDQDDIWHSDKIEKIVGLFNNKKKAQVINTGFRKVDGGGSVIPDKNRWHYYNHDIIKGFAAKKTLKKISLGYIIKCNISPGCTSALTRETKALYLENATKQYPHDWEINTFGAMLDGLYFYNEELIDYRLHENNTLGLDIVKPPPLIKLRIDQDMNKRIHLAENMLQKVEFYHNERCLQAMTVSERRRYISRSIFAQKRLQMLKQHWLSGWFSLLMLLRYYIESVGIKGIIGDFVYLIKREEE